MTSYRLCFVFVVLIAQTCAVYRQEDIIKGSLTFIIDDTGSMWNEIRQVKDEVNIIFEKVTNSNTSQIENFVLVTFNDPTAELRTITKDRNEFKRAVAGINVHGGGDCPEYAMKGIEIAVTESLPLSYLYVFTDASAKDYTRFEQIKSIAQKKQSQIVFLLTGECGSRGSDDYKVYHKVAQATNGQVFHILKDDVKDILKYIEETITGRGVNIVNKNLPSGYRKKVTIPVDSHTEQIMITVTGLNPKIEEVTGPGGHKPKTYPVVYGKNEMVATKVTTAIPGDYTVQVGSHSETHVDITARTKLNFQLGFSVFRPTSMKDTVTKPAPEGSAFMGITILGEGVTLTRVQLLDLDDNVIKEVPLELVNEKTQFYVTPSFDPPNVTFRVSVSGYDVATKSPITRTGPTPIERQNPRTDIEKKKNISPKVTIEGAPTVTVEYDSPLQLQCKVHGYPKPDIIWEEKETGIRMPAEVKVVEVPYDYVSILDIDKTNKNITYQCKASNPYGNNNNFIEVITTRKTYFDVIEAPKDITVEYSKEGKIVCKIDAKPPATITWYKDRKLLSSDGTHIEISSDKSTLRIKNMQPDLEGKFVCEARNDFDRKVFISNVIITGIEKPLLDKTHKEIRAIEKNNAELSCRILKGIPKPTIHWFFKPASKDSLGLMKETSETIHLINVRKDQTGSYKCVALNILGTDSAAIELIVEYPPIITDDGKKLLRSKDGDVINIPCDVTGVPAPAVKWFFNGTRLHNTTKTRIASDHSLNLKATLADTGFYTCEAENEHGPAKKSVFVEIFVPVSIEIPKNSTVEVMVGKSTILYCRADGYPRPGIKWSFRSSYKSIPAIDVTPAGRIEPVTLKNVQLNQQGFYTCVAENPISGSANITYEVKVYASPVIENEYLDKVFEVVKGDLALRIQCNAKGSPEPAITWMKDGLNLAIGSEWYEMEKDGTLIIKNIDDGSQGIYVCLAENKFGNDTELYEVIVKDAEIERPTKTVFVQEGKTIDIKCDLPHKKTDVKRWYKNGIPIAIEELTLVNVTLSDDGLYTCRVSDLSKSRGVTTKVVIGYKPRFSTEEEETVEFVEGADPVFLSCEAHGEPKPKYASWKHNGEVLDETEMSYPLVMELGATGIYECEVSNEFGTISRTFNVISRDCILDIKRDFPEKQPIMFSPSLGWSVFSVEKGYMIIPFADYFYLNCPSQFLNFPSNANVMAFCEGDSTVRISGELYNFADIKCNEEVKPQLLKTGLQCLPGNTEYVQVGYRVYTEFLKAYEVCMDKNNNVPLFAKHKLSPDHTDSSTSSAWFNNDSPLDYDTLYDCRRQMPDIALSLGRGLRHDSCCFARRQLVSSHDLLPGIPTSMSFNYLNVVPHWSTCNSKNWDDVEQRVRKLVIKAGRDLIITTGVAKRGGSSKDITLHDGRGGNQTVPQYLWKVVQDPSSFASLVIIQVNIPELTETEASKHVLCPNICESIDWMQGSDWSNVDNGFTYCCALGEFEKGFGYSGQFNSDIMKYVLFDATLIPEFSVKK